jgi:hypothetical protein
MEWTSESTKKVGDVIYYHLTAQTPVGKFILEPMGGERLTGYSISFGDEWLNYADSLDGAKEYARVYLANLSNELQNFLAKKAEKI